MSIICDESKCTGCQACVNICKQKAILMISTELGRKIAKIDLKKCVGCNLCIRVCPQNNYKEFNTPKKCFSAWSLDPVIRTNSASGGIAAELYNWAYAKNMWFAGVVITKEFDTKYVLTKELNYIKKFQNSKYVVSNMGDIHSKIGSLLKTGDKVLFIGLPCQVDSLKNYCKVMKISLAGLYLVDLICHGTAPQIYFKQHIEAIETKMKKKAESCCFRDPTYSTHTYTFTVKDKHRIFYSKRVESSDVYQIGFHKGIIYRDNCYQCKYAQMKRTGDLTLADFSYVGSKAKCTYSNEKVSAILINTDKGEKMLYELVERNAVFYEERPIEEELEYEKMLHRPTPKPRERDIFTKVYIQTKEFETAMTIAANKQLIKNVVIQICHIRQLKSFFSRCLSNRIKSMLKKFCHKTYS